MTNYKRSKTGQFAGSYHDPASPPPPPDRRSANESPVPSLAANTVDSAADAYQSLVKHNDRTLETYNQKVQEYVEGTPQEVSGDLREWIHAGLEWLPTDANIMELGSGFGRDADYMESLGYHVLRTDAAEGFVNLLTEQGHDDTRMFDAINGTYPQGELDLVFADAVLLHFASEETRNVLHKVHDSLTPAGRFAFTLKGGEGTEWSTAKLGAPRFFTYWTRPAIEAELAREYSRVEMKENTSNDVTWLHIVAYK